MNDCKNREMLDFTNRHLLQYLRKLPRYSYANFQAQYLEISEESGKKILLQFAQSLYTGAFLTFC